MFFRIKPSGGRRYLQIVENKRVDGKVRQVVRLTIGRIDELEASGHRLVERRPGAQAAGPFGGHPGS